MAEKQGKKYTRKFNRNSPGCILVLIDQSGSMSEPIAGKQGKTKADAVADAVNGILNVAITQSSEGVMVKDRVYMGVIGYGTDTDGVDYARPAFSDPNLSGRNLIPISEIENNKLGHHEMLQTEQSDDTGKPEEKTSQVPYWFEPMAYGKTPMCQAFRLAYDILREWVDDPKHKKCFPPIVINITDGIQTDGTSDDVIVAAKNITELGTSDGNALVYNCHTTRNEKVEAEQFPADVDFKKLSDEANSDEDKEEAIYKAALFESSSIIPDTLRSTLESRLGSPLLPNARGFVYNASINEMILMVEWGGTEPIPTTIIDK